MTPAEAAELLPKVREIYHPDPDDRDAWKWFDTPQKALGDRRPLDCNKAEVEAVIEQVRTGAHS